VLLSKKGNKSHLGYDLFKVVVRHTVVMSGYEVALRKRTDVRKLWELSLVKGIIKYF
jgi:hypothetical protein